jgi:hypothetical protein
LLLRASSEIEGAPADVKAVRDDAAADASNVPHAGVLLAWADATSRGDAREIVAARDRVVSAAGAAAAVDAAAIMANFERMTRIADATGIPLDGPMNALSADIQETLGLRTFRSAAQSAKAGAIAVTAARLLSPLVYRLIPSIARRMKAKLARVAGSA